MLTPHDVNQATIQQAIDDLEIGVPVRSWEVVDGRLYLHLAYSRRPAVWEPPNLGPSTLPTNLDDLLKKELQDLAREHGIAGWSGMLKAELVAALEELRTGGKA